MALSTDRRASAVGIDSEKAVVETGINFRPEIVILIGQVQIGKTDDLNELKQIFDTTDLTTLAGAGSPANLMKEAYFDSETGVEAYLLPIGQPSSGDAAVGNITVAGTSATDGFTIVIKTKGKLVYVGISTGDDPAAIHAAIKAALDAVLNIPFTTVVATGVDLTAKWEGVDGNDIYLAIEDEDGNDLDTTTLNGITFTVTEFASGSGYPTVATAIANIPEALKVTRIVSQIGDTTTLDALEAFVTTRRSVELSERVVSYYPYKVDSSDIETDYTAIMAATAARINDKANSMQVFDPYGMAFEALTEMVARRANRASINPGQPPRKIALTLPVSAPKSIKWFSSIQRNLMYIDGVSNYEIRNDVYTLMDLCIHYHPSNDNKSSSNQPIEFDDEDITAIGNMNYDLRQIFDESDQYASVKFIEDDDISSNSAARKLSDVKATVDSRIDLYVENLFLKDAEYAKENKSVSFNASNSERVDIILKAKMAQTGRIYDLTLSLTKAL